MSVKPLACGEHCTDGSCFKKIYYYHRKYTTLLVVNTEEVGIEVHKGSGKMLLGRPDTNFM